MVKINGMEAEYAVGATIAQYLESTNYSQNWVAVEMNGRIIPRSCYESTVIADGDEIEIVTFVGGG